MANEPHRVLDAFRRVKRDAPVNAVVDDWKSRIAQLHANLMLLSRFDLDAQQYPSATPARAFEFFDLLYIADGVRRFARQDYLVIMMLRAARDMILHARKRRGAGHWRR